MVEIENIDLIIDWESDFSAKLNYEKEKLPYVINLIDELRANENAHSRILFKLLEYPNNNGYIMLESFFEFLGEPFSQLKISKPVITAEYNRIDVRIRDEEYSVIIENKIHAATDQENQISKYIDNEIKYQYEEKDIYVLYLTSEGGSPSEGSITLKRRKDFGERYQEISYRYQILEWLNHGVIPLVEELKKEDPSKVFLLESAVIQYKNHIEGLFNMRESEKEMGKEMVAYVQDKLQLGKEEGSAQKFNRIMEFENYIKNLNKTLLCTKKNILFDMLKDLSSEILDLKINGISKIELSGRYGEKDSMLIFKPKGWKEKYSIIIGFEKKLSYITSGIFCFWDEYPDGPPPSLYGELSEVLEPSRKNKTYQYWPYWNYMDIDNDIDSFYNALDSGKFKKYITDTVEWITQNTKRVKELYG